MLTTVTGAVAAAAFALAVPVALVVQDEPPSIVQLCAATSITEVDALLDGVASSGLAGELEPLATLVVPGDADSLTLRGDVTLDQVRERLDCAPASPEPTTEAPAPTSETPPGTVEPTPGDGSGSSGSSDEDGFSQLDDVPSLPAQTGGGPA